MKLTTHLQVLRLRMRGAVPPLLPFLFMVWCLVKYRDSSGFTIFIYLFIRVFFVYASVFPPFPSLYFLSVRIYFSVLSFSLSSCLLSPLLFTCVATYSCNYQTLDSGRPAVR